MGVGEYPIRVYNLLHDDQPIGSAVRILIRPRLTGLTWPVNLGNPKEFTIKDAQKSASFLQSEPLEFIVSIRNSSGKNLQSITRHYDAAP